MSERRTIRVVGPKLIIAGNVYYQGDLATFPKAEADEYIRLGWGEDPETGEVGERKPGAQELQVQPVSQRAS